MEELACWFLPCTGRLNGRCGTKHCPAETSRARQLQITRDLLEAYCPVVRRTIDGLQLLGPKCSPICQRSHHLSGSYQRRAAVKTFPYFCDERTSWFCGSPFRNLTRRWKWSSSNVRPTSPDAFCTIFNVWFALMASTTASCTHDTSSVLFCATVCWRCFAKLVLLWESRSIRRWCCWRICLSLVCSANTRHYILKKNKWVQKLYKCRIFI